MMMHPKIVQLIKILLTSMSLSLTCLIILPPQSTSTALVQPALQAAQHLPSQIQMEVPFTYGNHITTAIEVAARVDNAEEYIEDGVVQKDIALY